MTHDQPVTAPVIARRVVFVVPGKPVAKGRPRFVRRGPHVRTYTPEPTERYENLVKMAAREAMRDDEPYVGPVRLIVDIGVPIPASWSMKKQEAAAAGAIGATKKPDWSNVVKSIEDGLNGIVYADDAQIIDGWVSKRYSRSPGVRVEVIELNLQRA
ncbi:RusA family crossover junction endodeoxyribonuclease [Burkholderia multivorans]|uniref:RusA family crossover junction endodeoxyribonuclease n=1 Tax=Burkholderia multivorans TaxID=87883 RepID=UPI0020186CB6|nr:RusA family crossover junction endodeoxyribonuclease [Burkholderia multivorans]UQN68030.1 RusA family crossover junction endodeoxyribonuclease [Burkholderia multivorans]UQN73759.1 RusA family crossover junction endodeoxyribonuclease [Burkholderia multivorans]HEJ2443621.1 RusA family crossover junction endodeoxyribonuclease [Burkholderia multivorans]